MEIVLDCIFSELWGFAGVKESSQKKRIVINEKKKSEKRMQ